MSGSLLTPTDPMTGVPLPIFPNFELPPVPKWDEQNVELAADEHHPFHPRRELLALGLAGEALRRCRVQWAMYDDHHEGSRAGYHHFYAGPQLPSTEEAWYKTVVFASAGLVPHEALTIDDSGAPISRTLSHKEHRLLLTEGVIRVDSYGKVKEYLLDYGVKHARKEIDERLVNDFLDTKDQMQKIILGRQLIQITSEVATEPFDSAYREAKKAKLLPYQRSGIVGNFVCNLLTIKTDKSGQPDTNTISTLDTLLSAA